MSAHLALSPVADLVAATLLARRANRPLFVLQGGVTAWWRAEELGRIVRAAPLPGPGAAPAEPAERTPGRASPAPNAPSQPKTKSAGC